MSIEPQAFDKKRLIYSFETWLKGYTTYPVYLNEKNQNMINIYPAYRYINVNVVQICTFACYKKMPREKKKIDHINPIKLLPLKF